MIYSMISYWTTWGYWIIVGWFNVLELLKDLTIVFCCKGAGGGVITLDLLKCLTWLKVGGFFIL